MTTHNSDLGTTNSNSTKPLLTMEIVFKYSTFFLITVLIFCLPGFFSFRQYCIQKGYYVFSWTSLRWLVLGFMVIPIIRYAYYRGMRNTISTLVKPKYQAQQKQKKVEMLLKLTYDTIFYTISTVICYGIFWEEHWFPMWAGGCGSCRQIYDSYPNWPEDKRPALEGYFMFHLGVHLFSVVQLLVFRRGKERKFYEWLLHHSVAATLILFSMMTNQIAAGVMILFVHDASDIFMAGGRAYAQLHIPKYRVVSVLMVVLLLCSWVYFRLIIFPFCLLWNVYINRPVPTQQWYMISYQYCYLLGMAYVLVGMHIYWSYCLLKFMSASLSSKQLVNNFDSQKNNT